MTLISSKITVNDFILEVLKLMKENHSIPRMDGEVADGKLKVYWVKDTLRIDIQYKDGETQ